MLNFLYYENVKSLAEIENAVHIRTKVFVEEQNIAAEGEFDEFDVGSTHIILLLDSTPVATSRIIKVDGRYKFGRFAVLAEYRGKGYGKALLQEVIEKCRSMGIKEMWLSSETYLVKFYEGFGFKKMGEVYPDSCGVDVIDMILILDGGIKEKEIDG